MSVAGEPEIALVLSAEAWVDALHRYCADHGGARVRCLVLDPAVALDEEFDVLVTSERWPALTRPFVSALHERGRRILAVGDPGRGSDLALRLGVDRVVTDAAAPIDLVQAVVGLTVPPPRADHRSARIDPPSADVAPGPAEASVDRPDAASGPAGRIVVVGGPRGAGSTEVALALAARSVRGGGRPVLVDADLVTPSMAVRLGLPLEPNLCTAVDAVAFGLGAVPGALFDLGDGWPALLVGVPHRRAGAALTGTEVSAVVDVLARRFDTVVVDVSAAAPVGATGEIDGIRSVVAGADAVAAVGSANPVGLVRLGEWLDDVRGAGPAPLHVVLNRAPAGRSRRAELTREAQTGAPIAGLAFVPTDPRVENACWSAALVTRGPFTRAVDGVYDAVVGRTTGGRRGATRAA